MFDQNAPISSPDAANNDTGVSAPSARPAYAREILGDALPKQQTGGATTATTPTTVQQVASVHIPENTPIVQAAEQPAVVIAAEPSSFRAAIQAVFGSPETLQERLLAGRRHRNPQGGKDRTIQIINDNARAAFAATTPKKAA
ncbi:hypothetical protein KA517_05005 [Candidatus Gracilibacteria bacterium]|jgi:hypothetical protein|nr:hypothetical protein [Candidatus Gracilibacteria bacterium]